MLELSSLDLGEIAEALADQADYERSVGSRMSSTRGNADLLPAWYAFSDARARRRAVEWLVDNSLVDDEAAERFLASHPDPELP